MSDDQTIIFSFYQKSNGLDCTILNLNTLSEQTIDQLSLFLLQRKGFWYPNNKKFFFRKKCDQSYLEKIFLYANIKVTIYNQETIENKSFTQLNIDYKEEIKKQTSATFLPKTTKEETINFGKHKGEKWSDIPINYLKWIAKNINDSNSQKAKKEIQKRAFNVL